MKVAFVHDWLTGMRGGERVLHRLLEIYPDADIHTLLYLPGSVEATIESRPIRTSFIQRLPGVKRHYRWYLPLFPLAIESLDLEGYDLVISSSHCVALGIRTSAEVLHLCYCHTPMRYIYDHYRSYFPRDAFWLKRWAAALTTHYLRMWDTAAAARVDRFVANSRTVARRIRKYYGVDSDVVHPPVDTGFFTPGSPDSSGESAAGETGYLVVSAGAPYKRVDLAVEACRMIGFPLTVVGWGPEMARWRRKAAGGARFLGAVSDQELRELYRSCRALIFPGEEDFGITPLEAMACGKPVVAFGRGGATESVLDGVTGVLFPRQDVQSLIEGIRRSDELSYDQETIRNRALEFGVDRFKEGILNAVARARRQR